MGAAAVAPTWFDTAADPDLWWHVATGLRILTTGAIPEADPWSFTAAGAEWVNHEWAFDVAVAAVFELAGGPGLLLARALVATAAGALLGALIDRRARHPLATVALVVFAVPVIATFLNVRAHTLTYAAVIGVVAALDALADGARWPMWVLPAGMVVWANVHGGFVLGLGLVGAGLGAGLLGLDRREGSPPHVGIVVSGLATLAAPLLNPRGAELASYLVGELGADHGPVSEWQPVTAEPAWLAVWVGVVLVAVVAAALGRQLRPPAPVLLTAVGALAAWSHARFLVVLVIGAVLVVADAIGAAQDRRSGAERAWDAPWVARALGIGVAALFGLGAAGDVVTHGGQLPAGPAGHPLAAIQWLDDRLPEGEPWHVANRFDWGGQLVFHLGDRARVGLDGRNLTVYEADVAAAWLRAEADGSLPELLAEHRVDAWLVAVDGPTARALARDPAWTRVAHDEVAAVFRPAGSGPDVPLPTVPGQGHFP